MFIHNRIFNSISFRSRYKMNQIKYIFRKKLFKGLKVESIEKTLVLIEQEQMSVSRYGDGEFAWMCMHEHKSFQRCSKKMKDRLCEIINSNEKKHMVCIVSELVELDKDNKEENNSYWKYAIGRHGMEWSKLFDFDKIYYNANITRFYYEKLNRDYANKIFTLWKRIWAGKEVLVVEGSKTRFGIGNDLLASALEVKRIIAPAQNAYDKYDEIMKACMNNGKGKLVLAALGPTATILCYDLARNGIWAIDIGHLDIEYEWFLLKAEKKVPIMGKYVNEAGGEESFVEFSNDTLKIYNSQIVGVIT